jgi:hypothetical protein
MAADGTDNLPPGTTLDHIDVRDDGRELTEAEVREDMLLDPTRYGYCASCAREKGALVGALVHLDLCETCCREKSADVPALVEFLRELDRDGMNDPIAARKTVAKILSLVWPVVGDALGYRMKPDDRGVLERWEQHIASQAST